MTAKNALLEALANLGWSGASLRFDLTPLGGSGPWRASAVLALPNGPTIHGTGEGLGHAGATIAACAEILDESAARHPTLFIDWPAWRVDAKHGDALIKQAARRLAPPFARHQVSLFLQRHESDAHLSSVYGQWSQAGDPDVLRFGPALGWKRRATLVEALIWRRFGPTLTDVSATELLRSLGAPDDWLPWWARTLEDFA